MRFRVLKDSDNPKTSKEYCVQFQDDSSDDDIVDDHWIVGNETRMALKYEGAMSSFQKPRHFSLKDAKRIVSVLNTRVSNHIESEGEYLLADAQYDVECMSGAV